MKFGLKQIGKGVFGYTDCWGISLIWGVLCTEVFIIVHNKHNSSIILGLISSLVKSLLKLCEIIESVGVVGFVCAKSVKESQTSQLIAFHNIIKLFVGFKVHISQT